MLLEIYDLAKFPSLLICPTCHTFTLELWIVTKTDKPLFDYKLQYLCRKCNYIYFKDYSNEIGWKETSGDESDTNCEQCI